jgi:hypothetical protein
VEFHACCYKKARRSEDATALRRGVSRWLLQKSAYVSATPQDFFKSGGVAKSMNTGEVCKCILGVLLFGIKRIFAQKQRDSMPYSCNNKREAPRHEAVASSEAARLSY